MAGYVFKPRAELLIQLGDQLIKNEGVALIELIKNSYDADATKVNVILKDVNAPLVGEIIIEDDGFGMDRPTVENIWLEPGNTHKKALIITGAKTPKGRLPIGEKGIGRFGVHKLGEKITLITRAKDRKEIVVEVDWRLFDNVRYLEDVKISIIERDPEVFTGEMTGTKIIIQNLRKEWDITAYKQVARAVNNLNSPFSIKSDFKVELICNIPSWDEKVLTFDSLKQYSLYHFRATIEQKGVISFTYKFTPFDNMPDVSSREISGSETLLNKEHEAIVPTKDDGTPLYKIGDIQFEMFVFDRDTDIISKYIIDDKKSYKQYLNDNGGIYVFRDNMRIYDYGERGNDWLDLDIKRVNQPVSKLSNNLVIGAVQLSRADSADLIEKANREGFIENAAYDIFKRIIQRAIEIFLPYRNSDKERIRTIKSVKEPVLTSITNLRDQIASSTIEEKKKVQMTTCVDNIEKEYSYLKEITYTTASAGLSYGVVIHEIEKIIKELAREAIERASAETMYDKILHLSDIIDNYANLLRNRKKTDNNLLSIVKQAKFNCAYRFKAHKIDVIIDESTFTDKPINCASNLIISSILNLFDNSIYWIEDSKKSQKRIKICESSFLDGYRTVLLIDSGNGFKLLPEDAIKPFVSKKPGGMGIGLNIVNEIMISHQGQLVFPRTEDIDDIDISDMDCGAIVGLAFKE